MSEEITYVPISKIDFSDTDLQMRAGGIDWDHVDTLVEDINNGDEMEASEFYIDEETGMHSIADGWHRSFAYRGSKLGDKAKVPAKVGTGGRAFAHYKALSANVGQRAKPLSRKDRNKAIVDAIQTYMLSPEAAKNMQCIFPKRKKKKAVQKEIAEMCKVNQSNVSRILKKLKENSTPKPNSEKEEDKPVSPEDNQTTFFSLFDRTLKPVCNNFEELVNFTGFMDPAITKEDKLKAIETVEHNVKQYNQRIKDLKKQITSA